MKRCTCSSVHLSFHPKKCFGKNLKLNCINYVKFHLVNIGPFKDLIKKKKKRDIEKYILVSLFISYYKSEKKNQNQNQNQTLLIR